MNFEKMSNRELDYMEGFIKRCAAKGIDPEALVKQAQMGDFVAKGVPNLLHQATRGRGSWGSSIGRRMESAYTSPTNEISGWTAPGRALGSWLQGLTPTARGREGMLHPTRQKSMFNIAGQQGAEQATQQYKRMGKIMKNQRLFKDLDTDSGRLFGKGSPYRVGMPRQSFGSGTYKPWTPPPPPPIPSYSY